MRSVIATSSMVKPAHSPQSTGEPPLPLREGIANEFTLDPNIAFLNHGSFGARPRVVLEAQNRRRKEFEARPIEWLERRRRSMIAHAQGVLGRFIGAQPNSLGFVTNATGGINAVLRSLTFQPGEQLLTTNHVYNAVRQTMKYLAQRAGAMYTETDIPLPLNSDDQVIAAIESGLTPSTRLLVIDHITSPTAVIFPVQRIVELCSTRGVDVMIDGAHAPGMIPLDLSALNAAYYSGNLHKWVCAPVGAAFLHVRPDRQRGIHPPILSHFLDQNFTEEFNWQGTRDITPWLCVEDAISFMESFGWSRVMQHNHELAVWVQQLLCSSWNVVPATPLDGSMIGSMVTVQLPNLQRLRQRYQTPEALQSALYDQFQIEVPVIDWGDAWWVRPCCQIYNHAGQYERLRDAVMQLARL